MPLNIIRNDITRVSADAIVNTANPQVAVGAGVDQAIYEAAGVEQLLAERAKIGPMEPGQAAVTPAFALDAKYIIHTVGPAWRGGDYGEREAVASCYRESLRLADELHCASIAFPLISTGTYGFPKDEALKIAISEISSFLFSHDMTVYMVVYSREAFVISSKAFTDIKCYIEDKDVKQPVCAASGNRPRPSMRRKLRDILFHQKEPSPFQGAFREDEYDRFEDEESVYDTSEPEGPGFKVPAEEEPVYGLPADEEAVFDMPADDMFVDEGAAYDMSADEGSAYDMSADEGAAHDMSADQESVYVEAAYDKTAYDRTKYESIKYAESAKRPKASAKKAKADLSQEERWFYRRDTISLGEDFSYGSPGVQESIPYGSPGGLEELLDQKGESFQQMLFRIIDRKGLTDPEVYKKANLDRKLFSKIRSSETYLPKKKTVLALAVALELSMDETIDLLRRAGIALNPSSDFDLIVGYCIDHRIYNIFDINTYLFEFDQPLLGA